jgi:hypothetical protein
MSQASDLWYVRLPDGQIVRANSTEAVRHHLESGRIPRESWVRRAPEEEWVSLEWVPEFAGLGGAEAPPRRGEPVKRERPAPLAADHLGLHEQAAAAGHVPSRHDRMQLQAVGARGMFEEMLKAVDSTLVRTKLGVACATGLLGVVLATLASVWPLDLEWPLSLLPWCGVGLVILIAWALSTALIAQASFVELSTAKAASWADSTRALGRNTRRLVWTYLVVIGLPVILLLAIPVIVGWLPASELSPVTREGVAGGLLAFWVLLLILLGPVLALAQLLGPIVVIEECSARNGLRQWWLFIRQHFTRLYFCEAFAFAAGLIAALPLLLPVLWTAGAAQTAATGVWATAIPIMLAVFGGVALTPLIAYLAVANVFIYLNLRYEVGPRR